MTVMTTAAVAATRRDFLRLSVGGVIVSAALVLVGCGGNSASHEDSNPTGSGRVQVSITWPQRTPTNEPSRYIPQYAQSIFLELYRKATPGNTRTQILNRPDGDTSTTQNASFDNVFEVGTYILIGQAYTQKDGGGTMVARAQTEVVVTEDEIAAQRLALASTIDQVEILGKPIQLKVGESVPLSGRALDEDGSVLLLPDGALSWSLVSGERNAALTANGILSGLVAGTAKVRIAETQLNLADEADVTVLSNATGLASSAWPKYRGDAPNTGRGGGSGAIGVKKWEFATGNLVYGSPTVASDGTVYIGSYDKKLYALDGESGSKKWDFLAGDFVYSTPSIRADGTIYFGSYDKRVYALDGATGQKKWEFLADGVIWSSPAISEDGTIYIGSYDKKVYALDGDTGAKKWEFLTEDSVTSSPAIGADGTIYIGSFDKKLYALDGLTGQKKWEFLTENWVHASPAIGEDGTVYVGSYDKKVYALDGATGRKKWDFLANTRVCSPAIGTDGTVYIGSDDKKLFALDGKTGAIKWEFFTGDWVHSSPAVGSDGTVYVGSQGPKVYALDGNTGSKKWEFLVGAITYSSPAVGSDGTIYIGSIDNKVYAIR